MRTLIIDRVTLFQEMIAKTLEKTDIEHVFSSTGKEALASLATEKFDCICLALYLDDMDGIELTQAIRKLDNYKHTPIVLLTSTNNDEITKKAILSGITDIFSKENVHELVNFIARFTQVEKPIKGKVLYIEDQKSQRDFVTEIFKEREMEVDAFDNAEDALQAFLKNRYHLVVTDLILAGEISGVLLINKIRRLDGVKGDTPILAITAFDDTSRRISLYHMGITDYVTKPIIKEELLARVRNLIKNQKSLEREVDFHEHLNSEEVLRRSLKMEALGKLTGGVAHDYNNMLGIITGYADLLKESLSDQPELVTYVDSIIKAGENGAKLTGKLLSFTRKEAAEAETTDINYLITESQSMLEKLLTAGIRLTIKLDENLWNTSLDVGDFENALLNICINAKHAIGKKGSLSIMTSNAKLGAVAAEKVGLPSGNYIRLSIKDTGDGMDKDVAAKIFDPFFSTKGDAGTGLGLSQVYGFMQRSHGSIRVESDLGKGTLFNLYFPKDEQVEKLVKEKKAADIVLKTGNTFNILVVDDEVALTELTSKLLERAGHTVSVAYNAREAISVIENKKIDVMISDVIMPGLNGYELSQKVKEINPEIKIILVSGYNEKINPTGDLNEVCDSYLEKPINGTRLLDEIDLVT